MMKWKVTKAPRCASADRSSDFLRKVEELPDPNRIRTTFTSADFSGGCGKSNGTVHQQQNKRLSANTEKDIVPLSENRKRTQTTDSNRKSSFVSTDCINLKGIFGLSRDRSDAPYFSLSTALENGRRRSRSEARGTSIDRLTVAYHGTPLIGPQHFINQNGNLKNGAAIIASAANAKKPRNASPGEKSGCWVRGRRREREPRDSCSQNKGKNFKDCRTVADDNTKKSANSKKVSNGRTIADSSSSSIVNYNDCEHAKGKGRECKVIGPVSTADDLIIIGKENVEINFDNDGGDHQLSSLKEEEMLSMDATDPTAKPENKPKKNRKKRIAPKPQRVSFVDDDKNGTAPASSSSSSSEKTARVSETSSDPMKISSDLRCTRPEQMASNDSTSYSRENDQSSSSSTSSSNGTDGAELRESADSIKDRTISVLAEVHVNHNDEMDADDATANSVEQDNDILEIDGPNDVETFVCKTETSDGDAAIDTGNVVCPTGNGNSNGTGLESRDLGEKQRSDEDKCNTGDENPREESPVSLLAEGNESVFLPGNEKNYGGSSPSVGESSAEITEHLPFSHLFPDEAEISGIFNDECTKHSRNAIANGGDDVSEFMTSSEYAAESCTDETKTDLDETFDTADSICGDVLQTAKVRNRSCFADDAHVHTNGFHSSENHSPEPPPRKRTPNNHSMRVNVVVKNPQNGSDEKDPAPGFVVKKSFVLTVAKQEEGFRSLCAKKDSPIVCNQEPDNNKSNQQISVTFLCAAPKADVGIDAQLNNLRLRSLSVPPSNGVTEVLLPSAPPHRSFSKDRRPKDRQSAKRKSHRSRKKDNLFNMPQAVIDELSQVLEHRKRVPDAEAC